MGVDFRVETIRFRGFYFVELAIDVVEPALLLGIQATCELDMQEGSPGLEQLVLSDVVGASGCVLWDGLSPRFVGRQAVSFFR